MTERPQTESAQIPARVHLLLAKEAPVAVIIKRGPSKWFPLVRWDLDTDELERGSWFRGRLHWNESDLSPDGKRMVYFAYSGTSEPDWWTAVCTPPWLKAIQLWPGNILTGGGVFLDRRTLWLNIPGDIAPVVHRKRAMHYKMVYDHLPSDVSYSPVHERRLERDGWHWCSEGDGEWTKEGADGASLQYDPRHYDFEHRRQRGPRYRLDQPPGSRAVCLEDARWADWDQRGRLIVAGADGVVRRYTPDDLRNGTPSFEIDANDWQPPPSRHPGEQQ